MARGFLFEDEYDARRLLDMLRTAPEHIRQEVLAAIRAADQPVLHWVTISSTTLTNGRYPGQWVLQNADNTFSTIAGLASDAVWIREANGDPLVVGKYYLGRLSRVLESDGKVVYTVREGTGATSTNILLDGANHTDTVNTAAVLGMIPYVNATPKWQALAGNTTTTTMVLTQTGTGAISAPPVWADPTTFIGNHNLLSATHPDTVAFTPPVRGDVIRGNSTPKWERLAIGQGGYVFRSAATVATTPVGDCEWGPYFARSSSSTNFSAARIPTIYFVDIGGGNVTCTLPDPPGATPLPLQLILWFVVVAINASTQNELTFATVAENIDGAAPATLKLKAQWDSVALVWDSVANEWRTLEDFRRPQSVRVGLSPAQSITNNTLTLIDWTSEFFDYLNMHSTVSNKSRLTAYRTGNYSYGCRIVWQGQISPSGYREIQVFKNGTLIPDGTTRWYFPINNVEPIGEINGIIDMLVTDYLEIKVKQNSGVTLNVQTSSSFWMSLTSIPGSYPA